MNQMIQRKRFGIRAGALLLVLLMLAGPVLSGCGKGGAKGIENGKIMHEEEFGGVYVDCTIDDFNALGFQYGDSVSVKFSNGYELKEIPYYNGYYTANGEPLLVAYPGYPYIKVCINNGDDLWQEAGLKASDNQEEKPQKLWATAGLEEHDTVEIKLVKSGKYKDIQEARDIHYKDERELFPSDEAFANFRAVKAGKIGENRLFRSASPCDNQHNRAPYVDSLMKEAGVRFILNLSDTPTKIQGYLEKEDFNSPYFLSLYESDNVVLIGLNMNYGSDAFREKVINGFTEMTEYEGPYLTHCTEGKDRTGFVCMLLEALCGASYEEIVDDYMITYDNYYQITEKKDGAKYKVIVENLLNPMIQTIAGADADIKKADLSACAESYLKAGGMSEEKIAALKQALGAE